MLDKFMRRQLDKLRNNVRLTSVISS